MPDDIIPDDLDLGQTIHIPRFGTGQKIFRRYILQKILGQGGMGVVWLARDEQLGTLVALKVLPETLSYDPASLDALKRETKLGLNLAHPNIVRIYDFQQDEGAAAISMEYVDGPTLSDLRLSKPNKIFSETELRGYLDALCDALHYAHTREKIVHRDLKPRNLMLNSEGELKVTDFGISKSISESMTMLTGKVGSSGSPPYISPQQWDGERPTPLDDIYSVGATLYELLSGKPPLMGVVDWQKVHHKVPPSISQRRSDLGITDAATVSPHWEETIAACLAKDPKDRPQSIRELQARITTGRLTTEISPGPAISPSPGTDTREIAEARPSILPPAPIAEPATVSEDDLREESLEDVAGDTIASRTAFRAPQVEPPSTPIPGVDLEMPEPALRPDLRGSPAPPDISVDTRRTAAKMTTPPALEKSPVPASTVTPSSDLTQPPDSVPAELTKAVTETGGDAGVASPEAEWSGQRDTAVSSAKKVPRWVWLVAAVILLLGSIAYIFLTQVPSITERPRVGDLAIESEPAGAAIALDQDAPVAAPHTFKDVKFGTHRLTVTLEGYLPMEQELRFDGAGIPKIVLQPKPKSPDEIGRLTIRSDPPGASIRLDGAPPQELDTFTNVKFGEHHLTAALDGFEPNDESLPVNGEMKTDIVVKLKPLERTVPEDPLQALIDARKEYEAARDWPQYRDVSLQLLRQLTTKGEPATPERREMLTRVIEGLQTKGSALSAEEFHASEQNFKDAAKLDIAPAILIVADNLRQQNSPEAFGWYYYAAQMKHVAYAMTKLAWLYWQGECGLQTDKGEAIKWFKEAHAAGDTSAGVIVAKCYLRGDGIAADEAEGIRILMPLAEAGVGAAKTLIGQCYYAGLGQFAKLPQNERDQMAKTYYEKAIEAGDWEACGHLGVMYEDGRAGRKDWQQAARLYLQGVEHENPICMYYYARAIEAHGAELAKLLGRQDRAETYYVKAAAASVKQAKQWCVEHNVKF